jgi:hypothetical protein
MAVGPVPPPARPRRRGKAVASMDEMITRRAALGSALAAGVGVVLLPAIETLAAGTATPAAGAPDETATGMVYDEGSAPRRGVPGVLVSNGRELVGTDAAGAYRIGVRDGDVLFVVKPSQWMTPLSAFNLPKFYYVHRPTGSPQYRATDVPGADRLDPIWFYKGAAPTGPLPASVDFPLRRSAEPDEFKVVVFGDTQVSHDKQIDYMARGTVAELLNAPGVAFGLSVGDLVNVGLLHLFGPLNELQAKTGFPWYTLPGNHDQNLVTPSDELAEEQYRTVYGPTVYGFEYGPASFLMLGNVRRTPFEKLEKPDAPVGKGVPAPSRYTCGLRDDQWRFVEGYIKTVPTDRQLVVTMHMDMSMDHRDAKAFTRRLLSLISGRPRTLSISGHTHIQRHLFFGKDAGFAGPGEHHHFNTICVRGAGYRGMFDELKIPSCQAVDGTPAGYSYLTFKRDGYAIRYKPSRHPADHQMNVFVPAVVKLRDLPTAKVLVNVFAGSERSAVRMRVNGGEWRPMAFAPQHDPSIAWVLAEEAGPTPWLGSKYNGEEEPTIVYHIWESAVPANLNAGTHTLEVETTDMFGQRDAKVTFFRIVGAAATA